MVAPAHTAAAMTPAELIAVLAWWFVLLAGAATLMRRLQPRGTSAARRLFSRRAGGSPRSCLKAQPSGALVAADAARRVHSVPTQVPGLPSGTLEPLCRYVDFRRRLEVATAELLTRLSQLPCERWRIEPYPLTGERRNTLLVLGETGSS